MTRYEHCVTCYQVIDQKSTAKTERCQSCGNLLCESCTFLGCNLCYTSQQAASHAVDSAFGLAQPQQLKAQPALTH